jgi:hypothetical protein
VLDFRQTSPCPILATFFRRKGGKPQATLPRKRRPPHPRRFAHPRAVCSAHRGVLTLISVPLNVRSGSVSVRIFGIDFGHSHWFSGWEGLA